MQGSGTDFVCHIQMLVSYHPCMVGFIRIIYGFMGDIGARDQCDIFNACFHNVFHNFIFNELAFLHFNHVHVISLQSLL